MNLPNKLTMLRVILIPFFVVCELIPYSWEGWLRTGNFCGSVYYR